MLIFIIYHRYHRFLTDKNAFNIYALSLGI